VSYYLTITNIRSQIRGFLPTLWGIFLAFRLYWIIPLAALVLSIRRKDHSQAILLVLIVAGAGSLLLVAYDTTRLMCMAFPAILLGSIQLIKTLPPMITLRSGALLFGMNFLITPAMVAAETFHLLRRTDRERTLLKEAQVLEQAPRSATLLNISSTGKEPERRTVQVTG